MERQENGVEKNKFVASIKMQSNFWHYNYKSDFILNKLTKKRYQTQIDTWLWCQIMEEWWSS